MKKTVLLALLSAAAGAAHANVLGLSNTGTSVAAGSDRNWSFEVGNSGVFSAAQLVSAASFPLNGSWSSDSATSSWVAPQASYGGLVSDAANTAYTYQTTFTIGSNELASTARLLGQWQADNYGVQITLNGHVISQTSMPGTGSGVGFQGWTPFAIASGFQQGVNTLDFTIQNTSTGAANIGNPSGIRVEFSTASISAVPEPETYALLGLGLAGVLIVRRRRHR
ncbi:PEP-CTERM sorting domain-containing protein [Paludibacterium yongneupense]|uniref:PEP-CTERM sorting domain-containing protein n=1 Tax=Paludibacterium yongneupense TaxID=400061 RepID=UPI00041D469C|nr:PEP-CTERM sorting domain-containing protein [Paludibacterium yongneupense]